MNKTPKILIISLIIILSFHIFQKFEFLFFKIKVCNNTDVEMWILLDWNKKKFFDKHSFFEKLALIYF